MRKRVNMIFHTAIFVVLLSAIVSSETSKLELLEKVYQQCQTEANPLKCLKVQVLKAVNRANLLSSIKINDNFELIKVGNYSRSFTNLPDYEQNFEKLQSGQVDEILIEMVDQFLSTHRLQVNTPKLIDEGRGNKMKKYIGPIIAALGVKGAFLSIAYKGVALLAGAALLVGKMALVLATILGLKLLLHHKHDKTTVEIVKHPHHSHKHSHSSSHDEHSDGHFYKNLNSDEEMMMQDKTFKAPLPYQYYKF